jgi:hypothetical protein
VQYTTYKIHPYSFLGKKLYVSISIDVYCTDLVEIFSTLDLPLTKGTKSSTRGRDRLKACCRKYKTHINQAKKEAGS